MDLAYLELAHPDALSHSLFDSADTRDKRAHLTPSSGKLLQRVSLFPGANLYNPFPHHHHLGVLGLPLKDPLKVVAVVLVREVLPRLSFLNGDSYSSSSSISKDSSSMAFASFLSSSALWKHPLSLASLTRFLHRE